MSDESNALEALKNAWNGALAASDRVRELSPSVHALGSDATLQSVNLAEYHTVSLAHANAAQALRGLVEELQRRAERV